MLDLRKRFLPGKTVVIIGGGFIGLELASSAAKKGCSVTLVEARKTAPPAFDLSGLSLDESARP